MHELAGVFPRRTSRTCSSLQPTQRLNAGAGRDNRHAAVNMQMHSQAAACVHARCAQSSRLQVYTRTVLTSK